MLKGSDLSVSIHHPPQIFPSKHQTPNPQVCKQQQCSSPPSSPSPLPWPPQVFRPFLAPPLKTARPRSATSASTAAPGARSHGWKTPCSSRATSASATRTPGFTEASISRLIVSLAPVSCPEEGMGMGFVLMCPSPSFCQPRLQRFRAGKLHRCGSGTDWMFCRDD
jgi:hypothetical protein